MSQKTVFHFTAGVCFVMALVLYVLGFTVPAGGWMAALLIAGAAFEGLALLRLVEGKEPLHKELG